MPGKLPVDPVMLLGVVNTKLRDFYPTLDDLCDDLCVDQKELSDKLAMIDYAYDPNRNQFV